jgi:hypothetical protein
LHKLQRELYLIQSPNTRQLHFLWT